LADFVKATVKMDSVVKFSAIAGCACCPSVLQILIRCFFAPWIRDEFLSGSRFFGQSYFSSLFVCTVGSGIRDENFWDPGSGMKNIGIRIRDKTSRIRNTAAHARMGSAQGTIKGWRSSGLRASVWTPRYRTWR
jgi:hypothetical protein